jgi:acyl-CoA synthetase (NDP forming)
MADSRADVEIAFRPRSMAVVGASANPDSPGYDYVRCLLEFGFRGPIYPVNPRLPELLGLPAHPSLRHLPGPAEYVISCIPAQGALDLLDDCRGQGVRVVQFFTGRFAETGRREAALLEGELKSRAQAVGVRVLGPNCMGVHHPAHGLSFRPDLPKETGPVAFVSQSGNNAVEVICHGAARGLRFGKAVNYGNALDLDEADFLDYLGDDPETEVIGAYIEGVRDGRRFLAALRRAAARKPTVVHKGGRTAAGARAAMSHTAALAGGRQVWGAALRQAGALQVDTQDQLIDMLVAFACLGPGSGRRVGVVGGGGGRAVQSADACEDEGLAVVPLPDEMREALRQRAPLLWDWVGNPVDQSILAGGPLSGAQMLEMMAQSPHFDLLIGNVGEDWILGRPDAEERLRHVVGRLLDVAGRATKPLAFVLGPADSPDEGRRRIVEEARARLVEAGVAVYPSVERAAWALGRFAGYWEGKTL